MLFSISSFVNSNLLWNYDKIINSVPDTMKFAMDYYYLLLFVKMYNLYCGSSSEQ